MDLQKKYPWMSKSYRKEEEKESRMMEAWTNPPGEEQDQTERGLSSATWRSRDNEGKPLRVLSGRKFQEAVGQHGTARRKDMEVQIVLDSEGQIGRDSESQPIEIPHFLAAHNLRPFLTQTILPYCRPLWFQTGTGWMAAGYRAERAYFRVQISRWRVLHGWKTVFHRGRD